MAKSIKAQMRQLQRRAALIELDQKLDQIERKLQQAVKKLK